ncbi:methyltransferase [Mesorhizobium marinum]|uniref:methyltransferase n=1 Tax=Mesorhizobium marinum TaxID=3228790 RepID=UPI003465D462
MSVKFSLSSGDPAADRRVDFALMLFAESDFSGATEMLLAALDMVPGWALGWYQLGEFHEAAGDMAAAVVAWRTALALDPADHSGASLKLALAEAGESAPVPPSAFVEMLFDQYAPKFDQALVDTLGYRVPEFLAEAIGGARPGRFAVALDLGCGTGLMGERLRPFCDRLEGFDVSAQMLRKAREKGVYDRMEKADLQAFAYDGPKADLVTAADVFMYVGALEGVVKTVAGLLVEGGLFAFSVESLDAPDGFWLRPSRRYAHSEAYVRRVLRDAGLAVVSLEERAIRQDRTEPVTGLIVVAELLPSR